MAASDTLLDASASASSTSKTGDPRPPDGPTVADKDASLPVSPPRADVAGAVTNALRSVRHAAEDALNSLYTATRDLDARDFEPVDPKVERWLNSVDEGSRDGTEVDFDLDEAAAGGSLSGTYSSTLTLSNPRESTAGIRRSRTFLDLAHLQSTLADKEPFDPKQRLGRRSSPLTSPLRQPKASIIATRGSRSDQVIAHARSMPSGLPKAPRQSSSPTMWLVAAQMDSEISLPSAGLPEPDDDA